MDKKQMDEWIRSIAEEYDISLNPEERQTKKQKQILEAAIQVFAEKGYSGASTSEIAGRAGVAEATIFKHYRTKKGLLLRLVIPAIARVASPWIIRPVMEIFRQDKAFDEVLHELLRDRVHLVEKNWKLIRIVLVESLFHPELREALREHLVGNIAPVALEMIQQLQAEGKLRDDLPPYVLLRGMISSVLGFVATRSLAPDLFVKDSERDELRMIVEVLVNGIGGRSLEKEPDRRG
ncbi:TetR/AcrR family transcriptional regulator [Staphylospora marina]|uniref:TetR/AcrR family transcriptional regulator n=1 Tax=Staphylospora marina TaxID=2490858 RepID=UPI0013DDB179|nr:TetR/AcrR family transcriptional regulator [Staphylospora marina]